MTCVSDATCISLGFKIEEGNFNCLSKCQDNWFLDGSRSNNYCLESCPANYLKTVDFTCITMDACKAKGHFLKGDMCIENCYPWINNA